MEHDILFGGIDVDSKKFHLTLIAKNTGQQFQFSTRANVSALSKRLEILRSQGYQIKLCYEATYLGYSLYRDLRKKNWEVEVIAPSLIPDIKGPRVKTDRLDSFKLARYYLQGLLTKVHVPTQDQEILRDLLRSRRFMRDQLKKVKLHLIALCRRHGLDYRQDYPGCSYWTIAHRRWLNQHIKTHSHSAFQCNAQLLHSTLEHFEQQLEFYKNEIAKQASSDSYQAACQALMCYRGIDQLTAMTILVEVGDIKRFDHPRRLTSYAGLDLIEYSSGGKQRRYGITKMGNSSLRACVVEACQSVHYPPKISKALRKRRQDAQPRGVEIADRCMNRLYKRSQHLTNRGKHRNKVKVACARELFGFIWESLRQAA